MVVLVTGGTGNIGAQLIAELTRQGEKCVAYDLFPSPEAIAGLTENVKIVKGDILNLAELIRTIRGEQVNTIVHTVALYGQETLSRPTATLKVNIEGTVNVLEAARIENVRRVVYASTVGVYGATSETDPIDEEHPKNPTEFYPVTKLAGELYGHAYGSAYGVGFVALRFATVYGPGRAFKGVPWYIAEMVEKPAMNLPAHLPRGRERRYEFMYVKDAAHALSLACHVEKLTHKAFNIGVGKLFSLQDIADIVRRFIPNAVIEIGAGELPLPRRGPLDISRARSELKYEPQYNMIDGIKDYIEWLRTKRR